ncbi:MAG: DNA recombination protein RmuC [Oligoflexia bacterium]|nr:MAG: DNA recombination protein RmuC [Oligoflexia bacterium]
MPMIGYLLLGILIGLTLGAVAVYLKMKNSLLVATTELELLKKQKDQEKLLQDKMSEQFELLAGRIIEDKSAKLSDQSLRTLGTILEPFKERLKDFEKKVEETYSNDRSERSNLRGELNKLMDLNIRMSTETENLTKALKGDVKTQGNWGEMILENILEHSGLRKGEEYIVQGADLGLKNDEGQIIRPDVVVHLPDQKHLIIDSKVSLVAYESYVQSETEAEKEKWGKLHIDSLKRHIDGLSQKKYYSSDQLISPDFVLLFMPIEPAFALAFRLKPDLLQYAWERRIALVSPTSLLTTLRTVAAIWRQERQERNALEIAKRGGALYDKFALLVEDLEGLGKKIEDTQKSYQGVMNKFSTGSGNLIRQVEMLKELGAKTEKKLLLPKE